MADSPGGYSPVLYSVGKKTAAPYIWANYIFQDNM